MSEIMHPVSGNATLAEKLSNHLETNYGLQLDATRRRTLLGEIGQFLGAVEVPTAPVETPSAVETPGAPKGKK